MKLIGPQIEALEAALMDAFHSRLALTRMLRIHLERNLSEITDGADRSGSATIRSSGKSSGERKQMNRPPSVV